MPRATKLSQTVQAPVRTGLTVVPVAPQPAAVMQQVRDLVNHEPSLEEALAEDAALGRADRLRQTPSFVIVSKGNRQNIGSPSFALLKDYLDQLLAQP